MKNAIYNICEQLRGCSWDTEYFEVFRVVHDPDDTYEIGVNPVGEEIGKRNVICKICERLSGCSWDTEYFEILKIEQNEYKEYIILVKIVNTEEENKEGASDDSNQ